MRDVIPVPVFDAVQRHLKERSVQAQSGWENASEDEDTLTGDFCGSLRTAWMDVHADGELWRWRITYKKFRGRGAKALEKEIGADGIVQVEVHSPGAEVSTKGVLFQAKKVRGSSRSHLVQQIRKMEGVAPGGSAVFEFGPHAYRAAPGSVLLSETERRPGLIPHPALQIGDYLGTEFLPCRSGVRGMYYDAVRKILLVPSGGAVRAIPMRIRHRVTAELVHESQFERAQEDLRR